VIAVLGAVCRSIIRIQKKAQEEEAKQALFKEVGTASEDLAQAFSEIFKKPGKPKTFH
jgi:cytochrome c556